MRFSICLCLIFLLAACAGQGASMQAASAPAVSTAAMPESTAFLQFNDHIHLFDLNTGKDAAGFKTIKGDAPYFSDDGKRLAAVENQGQSCVASNGGVACRPNAGVLHMVELPSQREVTSTFPDKGWIGSISFNPDSTILALGFNQENKSSVWLVDARTAHIVAQRAIGFRATLFNFTADGKTLAVYGQADSDESAVAPPPPPHELLLDARTLEVKQEITLDTLASGSWCVQNCQASHEQHLSKYWGPAVIPSKDRNSLYIVHADSDQLTTIDLANGTIHTEDIRLARTLFEDFLTLSANVAQAKGGYEGVNQYAALSPDGARLFVLGQKMTAASGSSDLWETSYSAGELQAIDPQRGRKLVARALVNHPGIGEYINGLYSSPDGKRVFVARADEQNGWRTEVYDATTLEPIAELKDWRVLVTHGVEGDAVLLATKPMSNRVTLGLVDPTNFAITRSLQLDYYSDWISP